MNAKLDLSKVVAQARKGDRTALGELVTLTQNRLYRFCLTLCADRAQAEDLCQEAYLKAFARLDTLTEDRAFFDWLFRIAKNLYLDLVRSPSYRQGSIDDLAQEDLGVDSRDQTEILSVHRALSQFEPEDRLLLLLVDLEEQTYKEAADILEITEDAVRSRLFRARQAFLKKI